MGQKAESRADEGQGAQGKEQEAAQLIGQGKGIGKALVKGAGLNLWHTYQKRCPPLNYVIIFYFCQSIPAFFRASKGLCSFNNLPSSIL